MTSPVPLRTFSIGLHEDLENVPRAARRVICNAEVLKSAKLSAGDVIAIMNADTPAPGKAFSVGVLWPSMELSQDTILVSSSVLLTTDLQPGRQARIYPLAGPHPAPGVPSLRQLQEAHIIKIKEASPEGKKASGSTSKPPEDNHRDWLTLLVRELLVDLKYVTSKQVLEVRYEGQLRRFHISFISQQVTSAETSSLESTFSTLSVSTETPRLYSVSWDTQVIILGNGPLEPVNPAHLPEIETLPHSSTAEAYSSVGGLNKQITQVRDLLEIPLTRPDLFRYFSLKPPRGILLHGPPGTGKTHLARAIASSTNSSVIVINGPELSSAYHGETEAKLRDVFKEAKEKSPCIVILDEVDALAPRREEGSGGEVEKRVVATLLTILDGVEDDGKEDKGRVVVIGTTNRPNAIDPALRRPGRFDREIEIGIPDAEARLAILNVLLQKTPHSISLDDLRSVASKAHGYVGADLSAVVREAGTIAIKRWLASSSSSASPTTSNPTLSLRDLHEAMPTVRPSAMRSIFVDTPPVRYEDIGGQAVVIQKLRETVEWPLIHPEAFQRLGVKPPKGILLYGPPGCSKTVLARACACESGVNFLAVKGPELLNKFVGESERAVREIFRKARAASPSIIFFDEIDALTTSRSADSDAASSHDGVLTSLLNEMDGVQELLGVTIIAATNRPEAIDSALMRPGRLDRILFVGPPDEKGREEILRIHTKKMAIDPTTNFTELATLTSGCSGAEMASLCQEAALLTMKNDINAPFVPYDALKTVAQSMKRQITPTVLAAFQDWTRKSGLKQV